MYILVTDDNIEFDSRDAVRELLANSGYAAPPLLSESTTFESLVSGFLDLPFSSPSLPPNDPNLHAGLFVSKPRFLVLLLLIVIVIFFFVSLVMLHL